jgi:hypothetical protein
MGLRDFLFYAGSGICLSISSYAQVTVSVQEQYFPSAGQLDVQRQDYTDLGVDLDFHRSGKTWNWGAHAMYWGALQSGEEQYFAIPELYFGESDYSSGGVRITVGREKRSWSHFDEEFGVGLWQPDLRWDYFYPVQQGLTGLFVDAQFSKSFSATFFLSPVFLPDQGPNFRLVNGQFSSMNRWFWAPQIDLQFGHGEGQVSYAIDRPPLSDILLQLSLGGMFRYQSQSVPIWAQLSWAYMPINQLHYAYDCPQCANTNDQVQATIHPSVLKHKLVTAEVGWQDDRQSAWLSTTLDAPDNPSGPSQWIQSSYNSVYYIGASYAHAMSPFQIPGSLKVSFLKAFISQSTPENSLVDGSVGSFLDRIPYQELMAVEWNWPVSDKWNWHTRYSYSIPEQGGWLSSIVSWKEKHWGWNAGVDVIGASVASDSANAGLYSRYRANDRVMAGANYAF